MSFSFDSLKKSGFKGDVVLPDSGETWTESTQPWGDQYRKSPKAALKPRSPKDVAKVIIWLNEGNIDFAIRSGGAAQSQSDSIILDLSHLNKIEYDSSNQTFRVGPGQTWREVYKKLENKNVTILGGRVGIVGVGGFTLGGGLSYLANLHGLASDSILDAQVVLADGSIVWAKDDTDLLFALNGAGHAFGVVTEFVVRAYTKPSTVFGGFLIFTLDKYAEICKQICRLADNNKDPKVSCMVGLVRMPPDMMHVIILMPFVSESADYAKKALKWAWELGPVQDLTKSMSYEQANAAQDMLVIRPAPTTTYQQSSLVVSKLTPQIMQAILDWQVELHKNPRFFGAKVLIEPFFTGALTTDDTKSAWPHSSETIHIIEPFIEGYDTQPGFAEEEREHIRESIKAMVKVAEPETILPKYPNYALLGTPAEEFYGKNLPRLREIKKKLDPANRFNKGILII